MHVRRLQLVGRSTLAVSIPKEWSERVGATQGDLVSMDVLPDNSLVIRLGMQKLSTKIARTIHGDTCAEDGIVERLVVALYLTGADIIEINDGGSGRALKEARGALRALNGLEVTEEGRGRIALRSIVDPGSAHFWELARRLYDLTKGILEILSTSMDSQSLDRLAQVRDMEEEADRIYRLIVRQLFIASNRPEIRQKMGIEDPRYLVGHRMTVKFLEDIGDLSARAAEDAAIALKTGIALNDRDLGLLGRYSKEVLTCYEGAFKSWASKDPLRANMVMTGCRHVARDLRRAALDMGGRYVEQYGRPAIVMAFSLKSYIDNLAQISDVAGNLAEAAINHSVLEPLYSKCVERAD
ncbi:MAG: PhoU domain-containing protein [Conexivisphaera sp.]